KAKSKRLKNVRQSADKLTFTLPGDDLGQPGVVLISLTKIGDRLVGTMILPDGSRKSITATKTAGSATKPGDDEEADDDIDAEVTTDDTGDLGAAEGMPTEVEIDPDGYAGGTQSDVETDENVEAETEIEEVPTTGPAAVAKADAKKEPLFPVNYPLGAFGQRDSEHKSINRHGNQAVFNNATLWTLSESGTLESGTLVSSNGKIEHVGDEYDEPIPDGIPVIDATGLHITPGLIDCHSHIATDGGINESGQAITCDVRIGDFVNPDDINIYRQLAGGTTTANVLHGSANPIGGQNQVLKFRWGAGPEAMKFAEAPQGVKFALGENVKQSNWNSDGTRYPQTRMGVPELITDAFRRAQDYERAKQDFADNGGLPVRTDLELEALVEMLAGERLIHAHSYRADEILALLRVLEDFDIRIATLQHILEGYKVAKEMAEHGAGASTFSDWWAFKFEVYDAIPYNPAIM
ncbi:MAG: hypothetical protein AAGK78_10920, partial [Planctomycetota bacterium]